MLCLVQFGWMAWSERASLGGPGLALSLAGLLALNVAFHVMHALGLHLERRRGHTERLA